MCGQTFYFVLRLSTREMAELSLFYFHFISMFPRKANIFSYLKKKSQISQTSRSIFFFLFLSPLFFSVWFFAFLRLKLKRCLCWKRMVWFREVCVLFCFSLSTDGSRCNQTNVLMLDLVFCLFWGFFCNLQRQKIAVYPPNPPLPNNLPLCDYSTLQSSLVGDVTHTVCLSLCRLWIDIFKLDV